MDITNTTLVRISSFTDAVATELNKNDDTKQEPATSSQQQP